MLFSYVLGHTHNTSQHTAVWSTSTSQFSACSIPRFFTLCLHMSPQYPLLFCFSPTFLWDFFRNLGGPKKKKNPGFSFCLLWTVYLVGINRQLDMSRELQTTSTCCHYIVAVRINTTPSQNHIQSLISNGICMIQGHNLTKCHLEKYKGCHFLFFFLCDRGWSESRFFCGTSEWEVKKPLSSYLCAGLMCAVLCCNLRRYINH